MKIPHPNSSSQKINCAVITVSDTRTKDNDSTGQLVQELLLKEGHNIAYYEIIQDEPTQIEFLLENLGRDDLIEAIIFSGGTGISPRDNTYDVLSSMIEKTLSGFGEIFRFLSYQEIGSRAIASRTTAGVYQGKIIFSLPGSQGAVSLGMKELILPELIHLVTQINQDQ